jgi:hypothetical protein
MLAACLPPWLPRRDDHRPVIRLHSRVLGQLARPPYRLLDFTGPGREDRAARAGCSGSVHRTPCLRGRAQTHSRAPVITREEGDNPGPEGSRPQSPDSRGWRRRGKSSPASASIRPASRRLPGSSNAKGLSRSPKPFARRRPPGRLTHTSPRSTAHRNAARSLRSLTLGLPRLPPVSFPSCSLTSPPYGCLRSGAALNPCSEAYLPSPPLSRLARRVLRKGPPSGAATASAAG